MPAEYNYNRVRGDARARLGDRLLRNYYCNFVLNFSASFKSHKGSGARETVPPASSDLFSGAMRRVFGRNERIICQPHKFWPVTAAPRLPAHWCVFCARKLICVRAGENSFCSSTAAAAVSPEVISLSPHHGYNMRRKGRISRRLIYYVLFLPLPTRMFAIRMKYSLTWLTFDTPESWKVPEKGNCLWPDQKHTAVSFKT